MKQGQDTALLFAGSLFAITLTLCGITPRVARAQELVFSPISTEACLNESFRGQEAQCIGQSATACMAMTPGGESTVGMAGCISRELDYWDARLNAAYRDLVRRAREIDAEMQMVGSHIPSLETALREMQRAWIPWRDATCDFERALWGGGTGGGPATYSCLMRLTGQQALYLESGMLGE